MDFIRKYAILVILIYVCPGQNLLQAELPIVNEEVLKFDFQEASLSEVLTLLSRQYGINIVAGEDVTGRVSGHFEGTVQETLDAVLKAAGNFSLVSEKDFLKVIPSDKLDTKYLVTKVIILEYIDGEDLEEIVKEMLSPLGKLKVFSKTYRGQIVGTTGYYGTTGAGYTAGTSSQTGAGTTGGATTTGTGYGTSTGYGGSGYGGYGGTGGGAVNVGREGLVKSDTLLITDIPSYIERIEGIIKQLDRIPPQVMIESRIMDVTRSKGKHFGIEAEYKDSETAPDDHSLDVLQSLLPSDADLGEGLVSFSIGTLTVDEYHVALRALETSAKTNLLSAPRVVTLDNQPAKIVVTTSEPTINAVREPISTTGGLVAYQTTYTWGPDVIYGIILEVIPRISKDGFITMRIYPEISGGTGQVVESPVIEGQPSIGSRPVIRTKAMLTQALVKSGDTVVIGGLIEDEDTSHVAKVPLLGDIPLLGLPFRKIKKIEEKKELLIFLTPTILTVGDKPGPGLPPVKKEVQTAKEKPLTLQPEEIKGKPVISPPVEPEITQIIEAEPEIPTTQVISEPQTEKIELTEGTVSSLQEEPVAEPTPEPVLEVEKEQTQKSDLQPDPEKSASAYLSAMEYISQNKYKDAQLELEKAVELDPDNEDAKRFLKNLKEWIKVLE